MSRRGYEAPMDFAYDNGTGPLDAQSPFVSLARNTNLSSATRPTPQHSFTWGPAQSASNLMKALPREPPPPSQPSRSSPAKQQRIDFTTPRKQRPEVEFDSSAGETPGSPDKQGGADSETATPDRGAGMGLKNSIFGGSPSKQLQSEQAAAVARKRGKGKRESFFTRMGLWSSPGSAGEVASRSAVRPELHKQPSEKVRKRSNKALVRRKRSEDDPEWEDDEPTDSSPITSKKARSPFKRGRQAAQQRKSSSSQAQQQEHPPGPNTNTWASFFTYLESHPNLPNVLSYYAQFAFNLFLLSCIGFILWGFWAAVRADVDEAAAHAEAEALTEIALCAKNYRENGCDMGKDGRGVVPALQAVCANWERCLERDPKKVGRASVSARTFARIFNSFVEPISYKAMIFTLLITFGIFFFSNLAFGVFRSKMAGASSVNYQQPPQTYWPPPTPQRHPSQQMLEGSQYYTPHHTRYGQEAWALEPAPSQAIMGLRSPSGGSPVKKLDFL